MCNCWSENPTDRWTFAQLRSKFDAMLTERNPYYFDLNHVNSQRPYYNRLSECAHSDDAHTIALSEEDLEVCMIVCVVMVAMKPLNFSQTNNYWYVSYCILV